MDRLIRASSVKCGVHYWDGQLFPALTSSKVQNDLRHAMRNVFINYEEAKEKNKKLQKLILDNFTWTHTANAAIKRLKEIHKKIKGKK